MANEKKGSAGIRYDDFVKNVRPDPGSTEQLVLLNGYVGASSSDDKIRLYSDASLNEYADIAKADIVYSLANADDPLGGSRIWVKQSANVNYADTAQNYAQGDMYNSYMNDMYTPGTQAMGAGAATIVCTIGQLTNTTVCKPTRFICPTPVSKLVICTLPPRTRFGCPLPTLAGCPQPSWVDACPSQWGCTIHTGTTVINPGTGGAQFAGDYTGGDVYNDYMQNAYDPGMENFGPVPVTSPQVCLQPISANLNCVSIQVVCPSRQIVCVSRPVWRCITRNNFPSICRRCWPTTIHTGGPSAVDGCPSTPGGCMTDITRTIRTDTINPGGGFYDYGY